MALKNGDLSGHNEDHGLLGDGGYEGASVMQVSTDRGGGGWAECTWGSQRALRSLTSQAISLRWEMPREGWSRGRSAFPACIYVFTTDPSCSCLQLPVEMARCHSYVTSVPSSRRCLLGACLCGLFWTEGLVCPSDSVSFHLVKMGAWGGFEQRRERRRLSF